jgi:hypothetical protein
MVGSVWKRRKVDRLKTERYWQFEEDEKMAAESAKMNGNGRGSNGSGNNGNGMAVAMAPRHRPAPVAAALPYKSQSHPLTKSLP